MQVHPAEPGGGGRSGLSAGSPPLFFQELSEWPFPADVGGLLPGRRGDWTWRDHGPNPEARRGTEGDGGGPDPRRAGRARFHGHEGLGGGIRPGPTGYRGCLRSRGIGIREGLQMIGAIVEDIVRSVYE